MRGGRAGELVGHVAGVVGAAVGVAGPVGGLVRRGAGAAGPVLVDVHRAYGARELDPAVGLLPRPVEHRDDLGVGRGDLRVGGCGGRDHQVVGVDPGGAGAEFDLEPVAGPHLHAADGVAGVAGVLWQGDRPHGLAVAPDRVRAAGAGAADPRGEVVTPVPGRDDGQFGALARAAVQVEEAFTAVPVAGADAGARGEGPARAAVLEPRVRDGELGAGAADAVADRAGASGASRATAVSSMSREGFIGSPGLRSLRGGGRVVAGKLAGAEVAIQWSCARNMEDTQSRCYVARKVGLKVFIQLVQVGVEGRG